MGGGSADKEVGIRQLLRGCKSSAAREGPLKQFDPVGREEKERRNIRPICKTFCHQRCLWSPRRLCNHGADDPRLASDADVASLNGKDRFFAGSFEASRRRCDRGYRIAKAGGIDGAPAARHDATAQFEGVMAGVTDRDLDGVTDQGGRPLSAAYLRLTKGVLEAQGARGSIGSTSARPRCGKSRIYAYTGWDVSSGPRKFVLDLSGRQPVPNYQVRPPLYGADEPGTATLMLWQAGRLWRKGRNLARARIFPDERSAIPSPQLLVAQ